MAQHRMDLAVRMLFGVAATRAEVLVTGPVGSGISKVAEVIHLMSEVGQEPFAKRPAAGLGRGWRSGPARRRRFG